MESIILSLCHISVLTELEFSLFAISLMFCFVGCYGPFFLSPKVFDDQSRYLRWTGIQSVKHHQCFQLGQVDLVLVDWTTLKFLTHFIS